MMDFKKIQTCSKSLENLINEIRVHWILEKCDNMLGLRELYEDDNSVYLVLDYQESGTLLG